MSTSKTARTKRTNTVYGENKPSKLTAEGNYSFLDSDYWQPSLALPLNILELPNGPSLQIAFKGYLCRLIRKFELSEAEAFSFVLSDFGRHVFRFAQKHCGVKSSQKIDSYEKLAEEILFQSTRDHQLGPNKQNDIEEINHEFEKYESKSDGHNSADYALCSPAMDEFEVKIAASSLNNAEAVVAALSGIRNRIFLYAPHLDGHAQDQKLVEALNIALNSVSAVSEERNAPAIVLPDIAPVPYIPRKSGRASAFLQANYGQYINAGICFRPDIKRLDPKLETALTNEFRGRTEELRAILPTRSDATDARLAVEFGAPVRPEDRKAAIVASAVAKRLKR